MRARGPETEEKKLIRKLYDLGSRIEIAAERAIAGIIRKAEKEKINSEKDPAYLTLSQTCRISLTPLLFMI